MLKQWTLRKAHRKTATIARASLTPVKQKIRQKADQNAKRIAEASLKASESFIDRTNYTINYRRKRALQEKSHDDYKERKLLRRGHVHYLRGLSNLRKDARKARKEDAELGPLAPKRDFGELKDKFGTITQQLLYPPEMGEMDRPKELKIIGQNKYCVHDRVVVISGRDVGKIGTVTDVDEKSLQLSIRGLGGVEYLQPDWMGKAQQDPRKYIPTNMKFRMRDVRLVVAATVNEKGEFKQALKELDNADEEFVNETEELEEEEEHVWKTKEFVLDHVDFRKRLVPAKLDNSVRITPTVLRDPAYDLFTAKRENVLLEEAFDDLASDSEQDSKGVLVHGYKWEEYRVVPGTTMEILDQSKDPEALDSSLDDDYDPEAEARLCDTVEYDVEDRSYLPMLAVPSMPLSVLDELRNKRSRAPLVTRIDPAILTKRETNAAHAEAKRILREEKMRTPLQDIRERRLDVEKQVLEKRKLSDDELYAKLGAAMEKKFASPGQGSRAQKYLSKMEKERRTREVKLRAIKEAEEKAEWDKKIAAEKKKKLKRSEMKGPLSYEKVIDFWPTDPKAKEAQREARRAEKEKALMFDARIRQFELGKELISEQKGTLENRISALKKNIMKAEARKATPGSRKRIPRLKDTLQSTEEIIERRNREFAQKERALDLQVKTAERLKARMIADAQRTRMLREAKQQQELRWV